MTALTDSLPDGAAGDAVRLRQPGVVHQLGPPRRGARHPRRAGRAQRGRRRHRARRPDLAPLQRVGPAAPGVRGRRPHRAAPQLPRQRRLRPPLAARQPLAHGPGRGARRGGRARVPGASTAATRRASRSPVAAGAASTPWPPSRSSRTSGPPASPASPSSTSSTASSTRPSARTCAGGTARTPATSRRTGRGSRYYSPINHLDDVEAPLLLLGGALDPRCPPRQIAEVAEALRARGRVCDYVVYPDEGHEISGLEHRVDYDRRTVDFILEHTGSRLTRRGRHARRGRRRGRARALSAARSGSRTPPARPSRPRRRR